MMEDSSASQMPYDLEKCMHFMLTAIYDSTSKYLHAALSTTCSPFLRVAGRARKILTQVFVLHVAIAAEYASVPITSQSRQSTYRKSGNFRCKNIFVVDRSYEN